MNTQFHTPSFGDEDFDLSDCGLLPNSVSGAIAGTGSGGIVGGMGGSGAGTLGGGNFMQQQHHQLQTKRVRNMEHTIDDYGNANDDVSVYDTNSIAASTTLDMVNASTTQYVNCSGATNNVGIGGVGMNLNMNTPTNPTMGARKQLSAMTPSSAQVSSATLAQAPTTANVTNATDPNEPVKPLSAYALFFHDTVSAIKPQNPNCSFQELTRIVASMWEALDPTHKNVYNKKNELARNEYLKQLRIYRQQQQEQQQLQQQQQQQQQQLQSNDSIQIQTKPAIFTITSARGNSTDGNITTSPLNNNNFATAGVGQQQTQYGQQLNQQDFSAQQQQQQKQQSQIYGNAQEQQQQQQQQPMVNGGGNITINSNTNANNISAQPIVTANDPSPQQIQMLTEAGSVQKCTRENCNKRAIINPDWEDEYCSNECVVLHCRNVFNAWVKSNLEARKQ